MTVEQLAQWMTENAVDRRIHSKEVPLTDEQKADYAQRITLATAALYDLAALKKDFDNVIKKGTSFQDGSYQPQGFTIPPTKGTDKLEENRKFADQVLKQGYLVENTDLYGIPYPEKKRIVFFDIEGNLFFDEPMNPEQVEAFTADAQLFSPDSNPLEA